jgi:hypothetical protein
LAGPQRSRRNGRLLAEVARVTGSPGVELVGETGSGESRTTFIVADETGELVVKLAPGGRSALESQWRLVRLVNEPATRQTLWEHAIRISGIGWTTVYLCHLSLRQVEWVRRGTGRLKRARADRRVSYPSYLVGVVTWVRPEGRVQRVTPGASCATVQSGACLARW